MRACWFSFQPFNQTLTYGPVRPELARWHLHCFKEQVGQAILWAELQAQPAGVSMDKTLTIAFHKLISFHRFINYIALHSVFLHQCPCPLQPHSTDPLLLLGFFAVIQTRIQTINRYLRGGQSNLLFPIGWISSNHGHSAGPSWIRLSCARSPTRWDLEMMGS